MEEPQRDAAREFRDIFDVPTEEEENEDSVQNAKRKLGKTRGMEHAARATMTPSELVSMFFQTCEVQCEFLRLSSRVVLMEGAY